MKRTAIAFLLLVGCDTNQPTERYGFVALLGRDTVSVESVTRRGNTLVSDEVDRFPRVRQRHTEITLGDDGSIRKLVMDIHTPSEPEDQRDRHVEAEVSGNSVSVSKRDKTGTKKRTLIRQDSIAVAIRQDRRTVRHPMAERRRIRACPRTSRPGTTGTSRTGRATTAPPAVRPTASGRPARPPRRRRHPRGPWRSGSDAASRRRGHAGPSGRRPMPGSGPGPRRHAARRPRAPRSSRPAGRPQHRGAGRRSCLGARRRSARTGRTVRDVVRPPHRRVDEGLDVSPRDDPGQPGPMASPATPIAIARVTARRSPTGG